jgi:nitroimidazol reductase NimA-like FMN-containing flavoprotein (pyridoxamine 5'-phosphate oxidase superfamily)
MTIIDGRTWLEQLSTAECWELLTDTPVGRLGVIIDSAPEIFPVNFSVHDRAIVFRTDRGGKLRGLDRSPSVCLQIDGLDPTAKTGWSVLVKGRAREVVHAAELALLAEAPLPYWAGGPKSHWIRITPTQVTGRRLRARRHEVGTSDPTESGR